MEIIEYSMGELIDPTGILSGKRFEFRIYVKFDEEDELYSEQGTGIRVIYATEGDQGKVVSYNLFNRATDEVLDFALEEDEEDVIATFCEEHLTEEY
ncbi:DUF6509 family protein [Sporosarcina highlanderae]|uniref:DUF6509 family protein n=1 Tax=Sporosarcina highlanderae TaxID=3035916 RepID=A0ABT8JQ42_9BACL|nr:DUF6509 family protein [Sporosarcina highlanderae]MDN4607265.1 DUF6509 family protein [Sporosarcina highlanderae]